MTVVLTDESGENKQNTTSPAPAPGKIYHLFFMFYYDLYTSFTICISLNCISKNVYSISLIS